MLMNNSNCTVRSYFVIALTMVLLGCAQTSIKQVPTYSSDEDFPTEEVRLSFGKIAIIPFYDPPDIALNATVYDRGKCAKESAAAAAAGMFEGTCGDPYACLGALLLTPVAAGAGAIAGAIEADSEEEVQSRIELIHAKTRSSGIADQFQDKATELAQHYEGYSILTDTDYKTADHNEVPFDLLREQHVNTVVQVGITSISSKVAETKYCDPKLVLGIRTTLNIFDVSIERRIFSNSMYRESKARELEDWANRDAKNWRAALNHYLDEVVTGLLDDVFLHVTAPAELKSMRVSSFVNGKLIKEKRPSLAWAWETEDKGNWAIDPSFIDAEISYDLRVTNEYSGEVVYQKSGLSQPQHKLEKSLSRFGSFNWQVRAHFLTDEKHRQTRWLGKFRL